MSTKKVTSIDPEHKYQKRKRSLTKYDFKLNEWTDGYVRIVEEGPYVSDGLSGNNPTVVGGTVEVKLHDGQDVVNLEFTSPKDLRTLISQLQYGYLTLLEYEGIAAGLCAQYGVEEEDLEDFL